MTQDLDDLACKIEQARAGNPEKAAHKKKELQNKAGMQAGMEFVIAITLSSFLGFKLDQWAGTMPLFLILFFLLGTGAGFLSVFKASQNCGAGVGFSALHKEEKKAKKTPKD